MKYDILVKRYLSEATYQPKRSEGLEYAGTKAGSNLRSESDIKKAQENLRNLYRQFVSNPTENTLRVVEDIIATVRGLDASDVLGNGRFSAKEFLGGLLVKLKSNGYNYQDILPKTDPLSSGKQYTIDQWKVVHPDDRSANIYNAIRNVLTSGIWEIATKERNVREVATDKVEVFYFDRSGNPHRTFLFVKDGITPKGGFWAGAKNPPPEYTSPLTGEKKVGYNPKEFRGAKIEDVKAAVNHDEAKAAYDSIHTGRDKNPDAYSFGGKTRKKKEEVPLFKSILKGAESSASTPTAKV